MNTTFKIQIKGRVQGVGFRPFIFNLAQKYQLKGTVSNNEKGVVIYCNTSIAIANKFLEEIIANKPEVSIITSHIIDEVPFIKFNNFTIITSKKPKQLNIPLTPDFAICNSCKQEIIDPKNKRFNYPFTTCVHCGPRYAITQKFPFERAHTSFKSFTMCTSCKTEYTDPKNIRFHSQTNSCSNCGVALELTNFSGKIITKNQQEVINKTVQFISEGKIIGIKNTNGYLLCCDATNKKAVAILRERKKRVHKPFAVMYASINKIKQEFDITNLEEKMLSSRVAPIVILQNSKINLASNIAPNLAQTGVMLPSSGLMELLLQKLTNPIVATSGNIHGSPIIATKKKAIEQLINVADYFVHHHLEIQFPQDDSVIKFSNQTPIILRRSRGLSPNYININTTDKSTVLAMGAHLKNSFTFVTNQQIYVSQYFGNLDNYEVLERTKKTIHQFIALFNTTPKTILVDKHPQYQSTLLGKEYAKHCNANLREIQHHKAHLASVLGEHQLFNSKEKILGVVWDGTGFGDDNQIWGGEFFTYQNHKIKRLTHFEYYNWLANDKMAKEPRLSLLSLTDEDHLEFIQDKFSKTAWNIYTKTIQKNTIKTSSVGRLFDAVASALNLIDINTYEAEAAMLLESCANQYTKTQYIDFLEEDLQIISPKKIIKNIITHLKKGVCKNKLAASFIYTLAKLIITLAKQQKINIVACSGGVFQNAILVSMLTKMAKENKINLKFNCTLSANDENISFGQLMYNQSIKN